MNTPGKKHTVWLKLIRNKGAFFGIIVIVLAILIAIFAYYISPDGTPHSNRMMVELGGKKPGFNQSFLLLKKDIPEKKSGFFKVLLQGQQDQYIYLPINNYTISGDSIQVNRYIDEGVEEKMTFPLSSTAGHQKPEHAVVHKKFILGTDTYGRDVFSRLLTGVRVSLAVGTITVLISLLIGVTLGAIAGYFRGSTDELIMWFINVIWSIPTLLLVFAITLLLGKGFWQVFIAIGLTMWVNVARTVRGQVLAIREREFIEAAHALGYGPFRIILKHILPNVMGPVWVIAAANFASAIIIEAGLSFLGIGVQPPMPSWGLMIKENYTFLLTNNPTLALVPGIAIMLVVLAFNLLGNGLRDAFEVKE